MEDGLMIGGGGNLDAFLTSFKNKTLPDKNNNDNKTLANKINNKPSSKIKP